MAVSKNHSAEAVAELLAAGHRHFGENRVQEAERKYPELKRVYPDLRLHLIGPLQSNKVRQAVAFFDVIETLDRPKLARALAVEMKSSGRHLPCLIEINIGSEPQKAGIAPNEAAEFLALCRDLGLRVEGLMCIPPHDQDPVPHFLALADLAQRLGLSRLSMGMSNDFKHAIACGATEVRIGSAIFGSRA